MNRRLFWKLFLSIGLLSIALVYLVSRASIEVEHHMSYLGDEEKALLESYRDKADELLLSGDKDAMYEWLEQLQRKEGTFATVISLEVNELVPVGHTDYRPVRAKVGRFLHYPVHLHHKKPLMDMPLSDGKHHLVFRMPDHLMPGKWWPLTRLMMHLALPLFLMALLSYFLYRHLMKPLAKLELATRSFSDGNYGARVAPDLNGRKDEIGRLALTFDEMAKRVGTLVETQRHLLHDLSHELRTPLQRIELTLAMDKSDNAVRLKKESQQMRKLVEDTLTLAWLQNEAPQLRCETVDLAGLLDVIVEDGQFEYHDRLIHLTQPAELLLEDSSEKALNMALENIIRNALRHTPAGGTVFVSAESDDQLCTVTVVDQGEGVPEHCLEKIFEPFFRVDKARDRDNGGFGLGLALSKRQIQGIGGTVHAENTDSAGLSVILRIPVSAAAVLWEHSEEG